MKPLSDIDRGWVAGLFEGEGCFRAAQSGSGPHRYPRAQMMQVDRSVLERLQSVTGLGTISGPYTDSRPGTRSQPYSVWGVYGAQAADEFAVSIFPLLSERRQQQILDAYEASRR